MEKRLRKPKIRVRPLNFKKNKIQYTPQTIEPSLDKDTGNMLDYQLMQQHSFESKITDIIRVFPSEFRRKDLVEYCTRNDIAIPSLQKYSNANTRHGWYDMRVIYNTLKGKNAFEDLSTKITDEEILKKISKTFEALHLFVAGVIEGTYRSLIVSGPPGVGKTFTTEQMLKEAMDNEEILFHHHRGFARATGIYKMLYANREEHQVLLIDDSDWIFQDETSLNLLKGALDTTAKRVIAWQTEHTFEDDEGNIIPNEFEFQGSCIFISNLDFRRLAESNKKTAPHIDALMSRSYYLDLAMRDTRAFTDT